MVQSNEYVKDSFGLSTKEALKILENEIHNELNEHKCFHKAISPQIRDAFHHNSAHSLFTWPSLLMLFICFILMLIWTSISEHKSWIIIQTIFIAVAIIGNIYLALYESFLRYSEIPRRGIELIEILQKAQKLSYWKPEIYPHLCSPYSPCLTLQWTYRDGVVVNLPWALLVKGDILVLKPGQVAPGLCTALLNSEDPPKLLAGDTFAPAYVQNLFNDEPTTTPKARTPLKNKLYVLEETPYLHNFKIALRKSLGRPNSMYNIQRHMLVTHFVHYFVVIFLLVTTMLACILRYTNVLNFSWTERYSLQNSELLIMAPVLTVIPVLPIMFPVFWVLLNCMGIARLKCLLESSANSKDSDDSESDVEGSNNSKTIDERHIKWLDVLNHIKGLVNGSDPFLFRSANIVHVLGSVTALCCIDKKGILSWPNPTAEKLFFLRNIDKACSSSKSSLNSDHSEMSYDRPVPSMANIPTGRTQTVPEVLDITHDHTSPFSLQFDDHTWKQHLNSLKPLGLSILLNTCNHQTQDHYYNFCNHVTCQALSSEHSVPVTNRRCLCELAKQIGFQPKAQEMFMLHKQLSTYRHLVRLCVTFYKTVLYLDKQPDTVRRDIKFARSLHISTKLKVPFPHMVAVVVKEVNSGALQLLSQGTADIIADSCTDYWDGQEIHTLSVSDRKLIQDFYQRSALTAYCTAYSYRPVTQNISNELGKVYLEIPKDCRSLYGSFRMHSPCDDRGILDAKLNGFSISTDSLLYNDFKQDEITDVDGCFNLQCNQIFIGMVTMQYQAQADIVDLIEQLERACIRLVHFSKENELRSRVFSEKMGLESGWNCHISLLTDKNSAPSSPNTSPEIVIIPTSNNKIDEVENTDVNADERDCFLSTSKLEGTKILSRSSPGNINLDHTLVKFSEDINQEKELDQNYHEIKIEEDGDIHLNMMGANDGYSSPENEAWRSLSCLTDSTEQSAPVNFDMSNRAKLPRGIENIRPHIEKVDNVPLLVSLFTDCTASVTREMLHIMQDYGEVVVAMGSSSNCNNMAIFNQADCSIAVEPLYPQVCKNTPAFKKDGSTGISPVDLSRKLNSVSCSISIKREDPLSLFLVICQSRHFMLCLWNAVQFWVCCSITLSMTQVFCIWAGLPLPWTPGWIILLSCLVIPLLSASLGSNALDNSVMKRATGKKNNKINFRLIVFFLWCYGSKFLPIVLSVLLTVSTSIMQCCQPLNVTYSNHSEVTDIDINYNDHRLFFTQHMALLCVLLNFVAVSIVFVHREYSIWEKGPHTNLVWAGVAIFSLVVQSVYSGLNLLIQRFPDHENDIIYNDMTNDWLPWVICLTSPFFVFAIGEFIKWQEIKANSRYQRRARLDFGTKLGMNSPF